MKLNRAALAKARAKQLSDRLDAEGYNLLSPGFGSWAGDLRRRPMGSSFRFARDVRRQQRPIGYCSPSSLHIGVALIAG